MTAVAAKLRRSTWTALPVCMMLLFSGCAGHYEAPLEDEPIDAAPKQPAPVLHRENADTDRAGATYVIQAGDTLYSIAWRNKLDFKDLARWNGIAAPYRIYVGKRLRLAPPVSDLRHGQNLKEITKSSSASSTPPSPDRTETAPTANVDQNRNVTNAGAAQANYGEIRWQWPARGKYEPADSLVGERGINIFAARGTPILAAAAGRVVYSGSGLVGYGKLIIIEHNDTYLSAYAHNDKLLVAEGARVIGGQEIAEMGNTGARRVMLHFEIRRNGKPVPPLQFLP